TTVQEKPDLYAHRTLASKDLIEIEHLLFNEGYYNALENHRSKPVLPPSVEVLIAKRDGFISDSDSEKILDVYRDQDVREDMLKYLYRNGLNQQYSFSLERGSQASSTVVTLGYDRMDNAPRNNVDSRITTRFSHNSKISKKIELQTALRLVK